MLEFYYTRTIRRVIYDLREEISIIVASIFEYSASNIWIFYAIFNAMDNRPLFGFP